MIGTMSTIARFLMVLPLAALCYAQNCSNQSWSGTHYFLISGTPNANSSRTPIARLGKLVVDNSGSLTGQSTDSLSGTIGTSTITGSSTVINDCSGSETITFTPQGSPATLSYLAFQLVNGAQEGMVADSDSRVIVTGRVHRAAAMGEGQCGTGILIGNYGFSGYGPSLGANAPFSRIGGIIFDGQGSLTYKLSYNNGTSGTSTQTGNGTYTVAGDCSGTVRLDLANSTMNFNIAAVEGNNVLFIETDAGTLFYGTMQTQSRPMVLPQFAFGGGWYSALYFDNGTDAAVSFQLSFFQDNGTALLVPALGRSSLQIDIAAHGTAIIEAPNILSLNQGYATFTLPPGVTGYGVFRQTVAGRPDQEAVAPFALANSAGTSLLWDDTTSFVTSVAMVNASAASATVKIDVTDNAGDEVGTATVVLPAHHKTETPLRSLQGLAGMAGQRGRAHFSVTTGSVAVLGLRFNTSAFTSIPAVQQ